MTKTHIGKNCNMNSEGKMVTCRTWQIAVNIYQSINYVPLSLKVKKPGQAGRFVAKTKRRRPVVIFANQEVHVQ